MKRLSRIKDSFGRGACFKSTLQDAAGAEECKRKGNMPKRIASCGLASGRIFNRYATVINVSDGVLQKILFQDKILKTSTSAGFFLYKKLMNK